MQFTASSEVGSKACFKLYNRYADEQDTVIATILTLTVDTGLAVIRPEQRTTALFLYPPGRAEHIIQGSTECDWVYLSLHLTSQGHIRVSVVYISP